MTPLTRLLSFLLLFLLVLVVAGNALRLIQRETAVVDSSNAEITTASQERVRHLHMAIDKGLLLVGATALGVGVALIFAVGSPTRRSNATVPPFAAQERERRSLSLLAVTSARAQEEISLERGERERAEEDSRQRLQMLNQALEEKIRIGRDLHDGVIQSLYAAGLNLESAKRLAPDDLTKAQSMVDKGLQLINRTIAEIRSYIEGLAPKAVRGDSLAQAMGDIVEDLRAGRPLEVERQIDEDASSALNDAQVAETLQILREAVSNALRHGGADRLRVQLQQSEAGTEFRVHDNGAGFTPERTPGAGHGLKNMKARADEAAGVLTLTSTPGSGTCVQVIWQTAL